MCFEWGVLRHKCIVINVYAKCDSMSKRRLWEAILEERRQRGNGAWCVLGDFNAVANSDERRGDHVESSSSQVVDMNWFNRFVTDIDRVLISEEWMNVWGEATLWVLPRDVFDHCLLMLRGRGWDWGPKPFRFNNFWHTNYSFKGVVEEEWRREGVYGWMSFVLKSKLKNLKSRLREWNREEYSGMEETVERLVGDIKELDEKGEEVGLAEEEIASRKAKFYDLWKILRARDVSIIQRSRARWMKEGDANSKYFHLCINRRSSSNSMKALKVGDGWAVSPFDVRKAVVDYFTIHVSSPLCDRPKLDRVPFPSLSEDENLRLIAPFSLLEIEAVVKDSDGDKSPGPDGFNFAFIKDFLVLN